MALTTTTTTTTSTRKRYCRMGHNINNKGYTPWIRKRIANLSPTITLTCDTCNRTIKEYDYNNDGDNNDSSSTLSPSRRQQQKQLYTSCITYACILCDFDMCHSCYYSKIPTETLLDLRRLSPSRRRRSTSALKSSRKASSKSTALRIRHRAHTHE